MNVWTDIAIGNLQRVRPPPLDIDAESGELFPCKTCGIPKPADAYYVKTSDTGKHYRQIVCKCCVAKATAARRVRKPKRDRPWQPLRALLAGGPHTLRQIGAALGISTTLAQRMIVVLIQKGEACRGAPAANKFNPHVPTYLLKTPPC